MAYLRSIMNTMPVGTGRTETMVRTVGIRQNMF